MWIPIKGFFNVIIVCCVYLLVVSHNTVLPSTEDTFQGL